ncbi:MAG: hypothetical protein HZB79_06885 [Deltaproteobacteria bacterium]|nr:hypothetical protein [Deltaproteobacteria bacterium]
MKKILMAIFLSIMSYGIANAQDVQTVTSKGVSAIEQGNTAIARDIALQDALRNAVEQAVGTMIDSETLVESYQVLRDSVYSKSSGYIQKYTVLKEGSTAPTLYEVTVSAVVKTEGLKNDLGALGLLHARAGKPRVLFMIAEQNIGQQFYTFWWGGKSEFKAQHYDMSASETALKEEFINKGFNIVDISVATGKIDIANAYRIADLTDTGAREIGRKLGAEVVIKGKAFAKEGPKTPGSAVSPYIADITASAIRVDNGAVIASSRGHGVARHISEVSGGTEALEKASKEMAEKIIEQITQKWSSEVTTGGIIQMTVKGAAYSDLTKFKNLLQQRVRGIKSIYQRSFEGGVAVLDIEAKGNAQSLADEISTKDFSPLRINVTGASSNTIEVSIGR